MSKDSATRRLPKKVSEISRRTVSRHSESILGKFNVSNRTASSTVTTGYRVRGRPASFDLVVMPHQYAMTKGASCRSR